MRALVGFAVMAAMLSIGASSASAAPVPDLPVGSEVYVGPVDYVNGSAFTFPIYVDTPADPGNPGAPDFWAYCIENPVHYIDETTATVGDLDSFVGSNYFTDPVAASKVLWVLAHGYPALSLADFGIAAGTPGITHPEALNAMQTAIWRYSDLNFDASWNWYGSAAAEDAYWYLVNGANASTGMTLADFATTVSVAAPPTPPLGGTLAGPYTVATNQPLVELVTNPSVTLTDSAGVAIDPAAVVNGQQFYLDLRSSTLAGTTTVTASVPGSSATGLVVSTPTAPGTTPTTADHAQSFILVAPSTAETTSQVVASWAAPAGSVTTTSLQTTQLAETGSEAVLPTAAAALVLGLGSAMILASRRRRA